MLDIVRSLLGALRAPCERTEPSPSKTSPSGVSSQCSSEGPKDGFPTDRLAANCSTALGRAVRHSLKRARALRVLGAAVLLVGCAGRPGLMPTPRDLHRRRRAAASHGASTSDDVARSAPCHGPRTRDDAGRCARLQLRSFALDGVRIGHSRDRRAGPLAGPRSAEHREQARAAARAGLGAATELGRFPPIPYEVDAVPGGIMRSSAPAPPPRDRRGARSRAPCGQ